MDYKKIGKNIYSYRKAKRLTQKQLAEKIDRAESTIQKYEKGDIEIPNSVLQSLSTALDVTYNNLVEWGIQESTNEIIAGISPNIQQFLKSQGYTLVWKADDKSISLIDNSESVVYVTLDELKNLERDITSYVKFKVHELFDNNSILE